MPTIKVAARNVEDLRVIEEMNSVLRALSDSSARATLAAAVGKTFDGSRDVSTALGYKKTLTEADYRLRYNRGGLAKRIVAALPKATWRGGAELIEDDDPETNTAFEEAWDELNKRLGIWEVFQRADILAGIGKYAVVLLGVPGEFETEIPNSTNAEMFQYMTPVSSENAAIKELDEDVESPRFGLPLFYEFKKLGGRSRRVHWSRVIHIADEILDDPISGSPRLEAVWNYFDDLVKVVGGGSEAFWARANAGTVFKIDPEMEVGSDELKTVEENADELIHNMRRTMAVRGVEIEQLGSDVADFSNPADILLTLIAGTTEIPKRILMGSERGELASTQDKTNWDERVADRRKSFAEHRVIRPFVDLLVKVGILPTPTDYEVRWPELVEQSAETKANIGLKWASMNAKGKTVVLPNEIRDHVLGLEPLEDEELMDEPPVAEVPPEGQLPVTEEQTGQQGEQDAGDQQTQAG